MVQTIERHITEAEQAKQQGNPTWWKIHEACMLALGTVQEILLRQIKEGSVKFDLGLFLEKVVLNDIAHSSKALLDCATRAFSLDLRLDAFQIRRFFWADVFG